MSDYVTLDEFKDLLDEPGTDRDAALTRVLSGAERAVERHCGRVFTVAADTSQRVFRPRDNVVRERDGDRLLVDDIGSLTGLAVETGTQVTSWVPIDTQFVETYPTTAPTDGHPVTSLLYLGRAWPLIGGQRVRVTARWGWPAVPDDVKQAVLLQANRLWKRKGSPEGIAGSAEWGVVRLPRVDPDIELLLAPLRKPGLA